MAEAWHFESESAFETHCALIEAALPLIKRGEWQRALDLLDKALELGESPHARWNRGQVLLALGRYPEGWKDYEARWHLFANTLTDARGARLRAVLPRWHGEGLDGRRLVVIHEAGFGDTIMLLRFLAKIDGDLVVAVPKVLETLAEQVAPLFDIESENDVYCTTFDLPRLLGATPANIPPSMFGARAGTIEEWRQRLPSGPKIGVAWSTVHPAPWRNIDLAILARFLRQHLPDHALVCLQANDLDAARAHDVGVHDIRDFADLAGLIWCMDRVVSIDTAALNLAGAIGHHDVTALLPFVPCWRWLNGNPWYPQIRIRRQTVAGDWSSALSE